MMISLIVAAAENNAIGKDNQLLWHLPKDMKFFKNTTWAMPVIMGRKTFESVKKALPGRFNFVITRQAGWQAADVTVAASLDEALEKAAATNCKEVFVIGGGEIYREAMGKAGRIYMTRIHASFEADTFFPAIDEKEWQLVSSLDFGADEKNLYAFSFQTWERR